MTGTTDEKFEQVNEEISSVRQGIKEIIDFLKPNNSEQVLSEDTKAILDSLADMKQNNINNHSAIVSMNAKLRDEIKQNTCKPTEAVEKEVEPNPKFIRRMWLAMGISLLVSSLLSTWTFNNLQGAFPFALGWFTFSFGATAWLFTDEFFFEGYSIGRIGKNAISLGITTVAISILFFTGITIGNSYIGNKAGHDNERSQPNIEANSNASESRHNDSLSGQQQPSSTRGQGTVLSVPASNGTTQSEQ